MSESVTGASHDGRVCEVNAAASAGRARPRAGRGRERDGIRGARVVAPLRAVGDPGTSPAGRDTRGREGTRERV